MKLRDVFSYSFSAIKLRKLRAGLTILGVVIGIAAIVALLSLTQGLQNSITGMLEEGFAADTLLVTAGGGFGMAGGFGMGGGYTGGASSVPIGGASSGFNLFVNDTQIISGIENVDMAIAIIQRVGYVQFGEIVEATTIVGVDFAKYQDIYGSTFMAESGGIPIEPEDGVVVVGKRVVDPGQNGTLLSDVNSTIQVIWTNATARPIRNETYAGNITAILKEIGIFSISGPSDTSVYIPISQAQTLFGTENCDMILVKLNSSDRAVIDNVSEAIQNAFSGQVSVISSKAVLDVLSQILSLMNLFLVAIAAISLLVAGIGIMNIMLVSLMERTREIGILKALGMKSRTVLSIFLGESVIIGLMGAVIGIVTGWGLANVVSIAFSGEGNILQGTNLQGSQGEAFNEMMTITPVLTPTLIIGALVFGIGVSVIFALYPTWRASKLKPVDALRYA